MKKIKLNITALSFLTLFLCVSALNSFAQSPAEMAKVSAVDLKVYRFPTDYFDAQRPKISASRRTNANLAKTKFPAAPGQTSQTYTRPTRDERFKGYVRQMFGLNAIIGNVVSAGVAQIVDSPEEWENNSKGFARRIGSAFGKTIIEETTTYGLGEAFKLDSNFYKSGKKDFKSRVSNAFLSTFTARKPNGKRIIGAPRIIGAYTANVIAAEVWYPKNYNYKDGLYYGTLSLGVDVGVNLLREFFFNK